MGGVSGRTFAAAAAGFVMCVGMVSAAQSQTPGVSQTEIRIGTFGPMTGANFVFGKNTMNGVETVFQKINESGGIHGRKLTLVREDDQCDPATAITVVRKLIHTDNVFGIIGGGCSNAVLAAKPDIVEAKIPFVNFAAAAESISAPPVPNIYTTMLTSALESKLQVKYAMEQGYKRIAVVAQKDAWGRDRYNPLMEEMKRLDITPVADEELSVNANDATAQVLKIREAKPDAVIMLVYPKPAAIFLRDAAKIGYKTAFIGQSVLPDPVAFDQQVGVPGATDSFVTISPVQYGLSDEQVAEWRKRIETMFPGDKLHGYNLYGIAAGQIYAEALRRAGPNLTREGFLAALGSMSDYEVDVYPGKVSCQANVSHQCHKNAAWIRKDGDRIKVIAITKL